MREERERERERERESLGTLSPSKRLVQARPEGAREARGGRVRRPRVAEHRGDEAAGRSLGPCRAWRSERAGPGPPGGRREAVARTGRRQLGQAGAPPAARRRGQREEAAGRRETRTVGSDASAGRARPDLLLHGGGRAFGGRRTERRAGASGLVARPEAPARGRGTRIPGGAPRSRECAAADRRTDRDGSAAGRPPSPAGPGVPRRKERRGGEADPRGIPSASTSPAAIRAPGRGEEAQPE